MTTRSGCGLGKTLERLQVKLGEVGALKRFFPVLGDVWNDKGKIELENRHVWNIVSDPLSSVAGSW